MMKVAPFSLLFPIVMRIWRMARLAHRSFDEGGIAIEAIQKRRISTQRHRDTELHRES